MNQEADEAVRRLQFRNQLTTDLKGSAVGTLKTNVCHKAPHGHAPKSKAQSRQQTVTNSTNRACHSTGSKDSYVSAASVIAYRTAEESCTELHQAICTLKGIVRSCSNDYVRGTYINKSAGATAANTTAYAVSLNNEEMRAIDELVMHLC